MAPAALPSTLAEGGAVAERRVEHRRRVRRSGRPLDEAAVRQVVQAGQVRLRSCYTRAMRRSGEQGDARIEIVIHIHPEGHVLAVDYQGPSFGGLADCVRSAVGRWEFPPSRSGGQVPVPFAFTAT
jgi:hypothetical protein